MKKILLIATGGTIACVETEHGMVPALSGDELVHYVPKLKDICQIDVLELLSLDSTNIQPEHWNDMAEAIGKHYNDYDGFVITHGTDTMAYSSSALYYMLENLAKPVIFTGSQLSLTEDNSDAPANLITAFEAAASDNAGVFLAFHGKVIKGNNAKKLYTESFDAFHAISPAVENHVLKANGNLHIRKLRNKKVVTLEIVPGFDPDLIKILTDNGYEGIILKGYGAGNFPNAQSTRNLLPAVDYAIAHGVKIIGSSQSLYDGVHMERYEVGRNALQHGIISGGDATSEALLIQLLLD